MRYLNLVYFNRKEQFIFDRKLQQLTNQKIIPKNRKPNVFEFSKIESVIHMIDKVDTYADKNRVLLSLGHKEKIDVVRCNFKHRCHSLGELISDCLNKPFLTRESFRNMTLLRNFVFSYLILTFVEVAFRMPHPLMIGGCFFVVIIMIIFIFLTNYDYYKKETI